MEDRLQKFVRLIDAGGFTRASRELHISQPALSVAVAKLERELHALLLVHGVRPLTLTPAGRLAYAAGQELQIKTANLKMQLAELANQKVAVSVGMIDSVAGLLFATPDSVDELEHSASVSLVVDNSRNLLQAVEKGELDMAFVTGQRQYAAALEVLQTAVEPLVVVCHPALQREFKKAIKTGVLPRFIGYDQASATHRLVADTLREQHITAEPTFYSTSPEVMLRMVLLQKGAAALPWLLVREQIQDGGLTLVGQRLLVQRPIAAVIRRGAVPAAPLVRTMEQIGVLLGSTLGSAESAAAEL
jgi:DNA-binding transcriptional LysR family regulator